MYSNISATARFSAYPSLFRLSILMFFFCFRWQGLKSKVDSLMKAGKLFVVDHELLKVMIARFDVVFASFLFVPRQPYNSLVSFLQTCFYHHRVLFIVLVPGRLKKRKSNLPGTTMPHACPAELVIQHVDVNILRCVVCCIQGMPATPVDGVTRYLTPSVALFEVVDDDLLPIKPIGIQVTCSCWCCRLRVG